MLLCRQLLQHVVHNDHCVQTSIPFALTIIICINLSTATCKRSSLSHTVSAFNPYKPVTENAGQSRYQQLGQNVLT